MKAKFNYLLKGSLLIFVIIVTLICNFIVLGACYKKETLTFDEGTYRYTDAPFVSLNGLTIEEISITFTAVDDSFAMQYSDKNLAKSRFNDDIFFVNFHLKFGNEKTAKQYDVEFLSKMSDAVDMYPIRLFLKDDNNNLDYVFILRLWLTRDNFTNDNIKSDVIKLDCIGREIGHFDNVKDIVIYDSIEDIENHNGIVRDVKLMADIIELHLEK